MTGVALERCATTQRGGVLRIRGGVTFAMPFKGKVAVQRIKFSAGKLHELADRQSVSASLAANPART